MALTVWLWSIGKASARGTAPLRRPLLEALRGDAAHQHHRGDHQAITLTFRLFGNVFAGALMVAVIAALLPIYVVPFGELVWKPFELFIGFIQAFIFALLTIMYFGMAMGDMNEAP